MKKRFAFLLALMLVFSLTACGNNNPPAPTPDGGAADTPGPADSDLSYVQDKGVLIVGITDFAPMDYRDDSGDWVGFDADMAKAFAESLGVDIEFVEIKWDNKILELDAKALDCVWNGMTLTDEVKNGMGTGSAYCLNGQVVVLPADKAGEYQTVESLYELNFAVENGSAGHQEAEALALPFIAVDTQAKALMEVASGASDACIIDLLMAGAMIGDGTSYPDLTHTVILNSEEYGVGFRKGSDLVDAFNSFWKDAYDAGTVMQTAELYGVQESIIAQ